MAKRNPTRRPQHTTPVKGRGNGSSAEVGQEAWWAIFDRSGWGFAIGAPDGTFVTMNPAFAEMHGYSVEELVGRPTASVLTPEWREKVPGLIRTSHENGHLSIEQMHQRKDGTTFPAQADVVVARDGDGWVLYRAVWVQDLTERGRAAEALRESEERFRGITETLPLGIFLISPEGANVYSNPRWCQMTGYTQAEALGDGWRTPIHPDERDGVAAEWRACLESRREFDSTMRYLRKDGDTIWARVRIAPIFDGEALAGYVGATEDVTERKQAEQALLESEDRFRLLAEHITEVYWLLDPEDYHVLYVNPAYEELWGRTCESLYADSRSWLEGVQPEDVGRVTAALDRQAETGGFDEEFQVVRPDGSIRWVWDRGFAVKGESGQVLRVIGLAADITERKQAEQALRQAREELEGRVERQMLRRNPYGLTFREFTLLHLVAAGRADKEIAKELDISPLTVHKHVGNILGKMNATSRTEAGVRALREGLLD